MKRFLSLLTVFVLAFALAVPVGAVNPDDNFVILPDGTHLELPDGYTVSMIQSVIESGFNVYLFGLYGSDELFFVNSSRPLTVSNMQLVNDSDSVAIIGYKKFSNGVWGEDKSRTIESGGKWYLGGSAIRELIGTSYFGVEQTFCDGSSCPATDANLDGICDDCVRVLSLRAPDNSTGSYPTLPSVNGNNLHSVVLERSDGYFYMALTSDTPYSVSGTVGETYLITVANETKVSYVTYKCTDGQNWVHTNSGEAYSLSVGSSSDTLLASTFDWTKDGEHFFPVPPTLAEATQEALGEMTLTMAGTMKTLVVCGVGLMACLMALSLFGKRWLLFLR